MDLQQPSLNIYKYIVIQFNNFKYIYIYIYVWMRTLSYVCVCKSLVFQLHCIVISTNWNVAPRAKVTW